MILPFLTQTTGMVWTTLIGFSVLYFVLALTDIVLFIRFIRHGPDAGSGPLEMDPEPSPPTI